jgi:hypothetical protein
VSELQSIAKIVEVKNRGSPYSKALILDYKSISIILPFLNLNIELFHFLLYIKLRSWLSIKRAFRPKFINLLKWHVYGQVTLHSTILCSSNSLYIPNLGSHVTNLVIPMSYSGLPWHEPGIPSCQAHLILTPVWETGLPYILFWVPIFMFRDPTLSKWDPHLTHEFYSGTPCRCRFKCSSKRIMWPKNESFILLEKA